MPRKFGVLVVLALLVVTPWRASSAAADPKLGGSCLKTQWGFTRGSLTCRSEPYKGNFRYLWKTAAPTFTANVSKPCAKAFAELAIVANDANALDETKQQSATMTACESRSEWKAGAARYQGKMFPSKKSIVTLDRVLDAFCSDTIANARACRD